LTKRLIFPSFFATEAVEGVDGRRLTSCTHSHKFNEEVVMRINWNQSASVAGVLLLTVLVVPSPLQAAKVKTEDELINDLGAAKAGTVTVALQQLEKNYPTSPKALPLIKGLLKDPRSEVRCKAARVLGAVHADVSDADITAICALLKAGDPKEVGEGLKALRGLKAPGAVPEILPLLKDADTHTVRDACRTLAVLANKDVIPSIEPLLNHADKAVRKDAEDAIFKLREKS
jgi:HEAT repeat protein